MYVLIKKNFLRVLTVSFGLAPIVVNAADSKEGWYVTAIYQQASLRSTDTEGIFTTQECNAVTGCTTTTETQDFRTSFDDDNGFGVSVGYDMSGPLRVEAEYRKHSHDVNGGQFVRNEALKVEALILNIWRDLELGWSGIVPYFGGGFGINRLELRDADDVILVGQVGAGLSWAFLDRFAVDIGYRYYVTEPDAVLDGETGGGNERELTFEYQGSSILLGVRLNFF